MVRFKGFGIIQLYTACFDINLLYSTFFIHSRHCLLASIRFPILAAIIAKINAKINDPSHTKILIFPPKDEHFLNF